MRQSSAQLPDVVTGSFDRDVTVDVWHGSDRVAEGMGVEAWSLDSDLQGEIKTSGSFTLIIESVGGESVAPSGTDGVLSPFRATIEPLFRVSAGAFEEAVSLGQFRVVRVVSVTEMTVMLEGRAVVLGAAVEVEVESLDRMIWRRGFTSPESPQSLSSCWGEIRRITGMPVSESVPDMAIPRSTVWEAEQGGRLAAVQTLADVLGGVAVIDSTAAVTVVPDTVGDPVLELTVGEDGTIIDMGAEIDTDDVYNQVVGVFEMDNRDRTPIYARAQVTSGPLSVNGTYGTYTRYYSSDMVSTQAQANAAVQSVLAMSVGGQSYDVVVSCIVNPLVEIGDVVSVTDLVGQVVAVQIGDGALMQVTVRVRRAL